MLSMSSCPSDIYYPANHRCCPILLTGKGKARKKKQTPSSCNKTSSGCHMPRLAERICCKLVSKTPPVVTYHRQKWILTRKLSIRHKNLERSSFFWGQNSLVKSVFFGEAICSRLFLVAKWNRFLAWCPLKEMETIPAKCFLL